MYEHVSVTKVCTYMSVTNVCSCVRKGTHDMEMTFYENDIPDRRLLGRCAKHGRPHTLNAGDDDDGDDDDGNDNDDDDQNKVIMIIMMMMIK